MVKETDSKETKSTPDSSMKRLCSVRFAPLWVVMVSFIVALNLIGAQLFFRWRSRSADYWLSRTDQLIDTVNEGVNLFRSIESSRNLALLRGEGSLGVTLSPEELTLREEILPAIKRLTGDIPTLKELGKRLTQEMRSRLDGFHESDILTELGDYSSIRAAIERSELERLRGDIRLITQNLLTEQERLRNIRDGEFAQSLNHFLAFMISGSAVVSLLLVISLRRVRRELALREHAESAARESERLEHARATELQTLLDTVPAVVLFSQDRESRVVSGSREAYAALRLPIGANTSKTAILASPEHFKLFRNGIELPLDELPVQYAARTGQAVRDTELEVVFQDGVVRHLFGSVQPLFDEAGEPRGSIACFTDITERKEADLLLKASDARWKLSLETGQLGFFEYDYERGTTRWNDSESRLIGYEPGAIDPTPDAFFDAVHPDDRERLQHDWAEALKNGRLDAEFRIIRPDGEVRWLVGKGTVIQDMAGRKRWFTGVNIDITRAKLIEEDLSRAVRERTEALNTLNAFLSAAPLAMGVLDREGQCRFINPPLAELVKQLPQNEEATPPKAPIPGFGSIFRPRFEEVLTKGATIRDYEVERCLPVDPNQQHTWVESWFPIKGEGNEISAVGVIVQDVTERKRVEVELARHRDKLQEIVDQRTQELADSLQRLHLSERLAALGNLAAGLGHDLANLVLPIRARLESLSLSPLNPEMRGDIVAIGQALDHLSNLSAGMRLMSLDPTRPRAASEATDLTVWWAEAQGVFRGVLPRNVQLEGKVDSGLGVALPRHQLLQAIFNLVQNAGEILEGTPSGWVRVEITPDPTAADSYVVIKVSDNGPGMTEDVKARCFEPYFSTKGRTISTGMGLSLVRGLVESVKGSITVESKLGSGTTFILRLPRVSPADRLLARSGAPARSAVVSITEPRQAALATMIAERLHLTVEALEDRSTPKAEVWITDSASRGEVEHFLGEEIEHRVVYLGIRSFDPASLNEIAQYRGRVVALPLRPAPMVLRDTLARVIEGERPQ